MESLTESFKENYAESSTNIEKDLNKMGFKKSSQIISLYSKNRGIIKLVYKSGFDGRNNALNQISKILPSECKEDIKSSVKSLINIIIRLNEENGIFSPNLLGDKKVNERYETEMNSIINEGIIEVGKLKQYLNQNHLNTAMVYIAPLRAKKINDKLYHFQSESNKELYVFNNGV